MINIASYFFVPVLQFNMTTYSNNTIRECTLALWAVQLSQWKEVITVRTWLKRFFNFTFIRLPIIGNMY